MSFEDFVGEHSLLPLFQMVPPEEKSAKHGVAVQADMSARHGIRTWEKTGARFCKECVSEEIDFKGYAIWHRSHQLPGVCWCSKHNTQLAISANSKNPFDDMPSTELEVSYEFDEETFAEIRLNPVIQRYWDILSSILLGNQSLSALHAIYRMAELLKTEQIRVGKKGQRPTMTDRLLSEVPLAWLQSLYPAVSSRKPEQYFEAIDSIASRPVSNHVYVLGLASFFESADSAVEFWNSDTDNLPNARQGCRRLEKGYWNSDELCQLYINLQGNYRRISEELGVQYSHTKEMLRKVGLPSIWNSNFAAIGKVIEDLQMGLPIDETCEVNGVRQVDIEKFLQGDVAKLLRALKAVGLIEHRISRERLFQTQTTEPAYI